MTDPHARQLLLPDGRILGYAELGDPEGRPLFYCHGFPASRLEAMLMDETARDLGIRVISADRPGFGISEYQSGRTIGGWPEDVLSLADHLGIIRFAVLGVSGGGPYALACAGKIPHRLTGVGVVCGLGPTTDYRLVRRMEWPARLSFLLARRARPLLRLLYEGILGPLIRRNPAAAIRLLTVNSPPPDGRVLARPEVHSILAASIREAFRRGGRGATQELILYSSPWGFALEKISFPVRLWHGLEDATVPAAMGRIQAAALPAATALFLPEEGHFSLPIRHRSDILKTLAP